MTEGNTITVITELLPVFRMDTCNGEIISSNGKFRRLIHLPGEGAESFSHFAEMGDVSLTELTGESVFAQFQGELKSKGVIENREVTFYLHPPVHVSLSIKMIPGTSHAEGFCTDITHFSKARQKYLSRRSIGEEMRMLTELAFNNSDSGADVISQALERIGKFSNISKISVVQLSDTEPYIYQSHEWCAEGTIPSGSRVENLDPLQFSWWTETLFNEGIIVINDYNTLPPEASAGVRLAKQLGHKSQVSVLVATRTGKKGFVSFICCKRCRFWSEEDIYVFTTTSRFLFHAIHHNLVLQELVRSRQLLKSKVLERTFELKKAYDRLVKENSEKTRLQNELKESEFRYRSIVENQTEYIIRFSPDNFKITFMNEPVCRLKNLTPADVYGRPVTDFMSEKPLKYFNLILQGLSPENPSFEIEFAPWGDKPEIWHEWKFTTIYNKDGSVREYQAIGRDISKRKQAQFALEKSEKFYRGFFESKTLFVCRINLKAEFTYVNNALCNFLGHPREELLGKCLKDFHFEEELIPDNIALGYLTLPPFGFTNEYRLKTSGGIQWISWEFFSVFDERGSMTEAVGLGKDITERKSAK